MADTGEESKEQESLALFHLKRENADLTAKLAAAQKDISEWRVLAAELLKTIRKLDPQGFATIDAAIREAKEAA